MRDEKEKMAVYDLLKSQSGPVSTPEIIRLQAKTGSNIPERTLRRWLSNWVSEGLVHREGNKRGTRYRMNPAAHARPAFLNSIPASKRPHIEAQVRDLWTHSSTAIEGNTLSLGDTRAVLEYGLTVSGKPLREHQEVLGHARAIDLIYSLIGNVVDQDGLFRLHQAVQTDHIVDSMRPVGSWKLEPNFASTMTSDGAAVIIEYAAPASVEALMFEVFEYLLGPGSQMLNQHAAIEAYAWIHIGIVHIHPFFDGNGRIARLVANLPLLRSGLPPLIIDQADRRRYIELLADYQVAVGKLTHKTGVWPAPGLLTPFVAFCTEQYQRTRKQLALHQSQVDLELDSKDESD